jgi:ubiquinone/menaquinone biosynthesis C-methylase UbiE
MAKTRKTSKKLSKRKPIKPAKLAKSARPAKSAKPAKPAQPPVSPQRLTELAWGFAPMLILHAALAHKIFDLLDAGPKTADELASATATSPRGIRALLESLVGLGVVRRKKDRFALAADTAMFMVSTKPGFLGGLVNHFAAQLLDNWRKLPEIVRTGKPATMVDHEDQGAEFFSKFVEDLFNLSFAASQSLADQLAKPLSRNNPLKILDIAAGSGVWSIPYAQRVPHAQITAVDFHQVLPVTRRVAGRFGVDSRLGSIEGDIQTADFGAGYHLATLGHILHSEGEAKSRRLLKKVYDALAPGGMIAIAEFIPNDDRNGPAYPLIFAVNMLVHTETGDTFSFKQMSGWLREIGFGKIRKVDVPAPSPIVVATKPG